MGASEIDMEELWPKKRYQKNNLGCIVTSEKKTYFSCTNDKNYAKN